MKKMHAVLLVGAAVLLASAVGLWQQRSDTPAIAEVTYRCDNNKTITAAYYEGRDMPPAQPGEPPVPAGSVVISLDGGPAVPLAQTISASGIRYANGDESLVFWSKGDEALVMRNNEMDLAYTNCRAQ